MHKMQRNVRLFYVYIFLNRLEMWLPVTTLLVTGRGFSLTQYTILDALWYVSTLVFEVPTGVVADRYGKKISLLLALLFQSVSLLILALASSFPGMAISYVLWGLGSSFETGTHSGLIYDSLKRINREGDFRRVTGRITTVAILAGALGSIIGGYLASIELALPVILTGSIALLTLPLVLLLKEPEVSAVSEPSHLLHIRESVRYVSRRRSVALLIMYLAIIETAVWGLHDFYQPFLSSFKVPVERIGLLYLFFRLFGVGGAHFSDSISRVAGRASVFLIIPLFLVVSILGMGFFVAPWVIGFIFVIHFIDGFHYPLLNDLLNKSLPPSKRVTIISLGSVLACCMGAVLYPTLGRIADLFSLQMTFKVLGLGILLCMTLILVFLRTESIWRPVPESASLGKLK